MGSIFSSRGGSLSRILQLIFEWRSKTDLKFQIPWNKSHFSAILDYVLKFEGINSDFCATSHRKLRADEVWHRRFEPRYYNEFATRILIFMRELRELFEVPKLQQCSLKKNELVAAFISFVLQLLDYETEFIVPYKDRIVYLKKELRFLVTILGDTPFLGAEFEVLNLLAEFEAVANEAGSLVCSFIFTTHRLFNSRGMDKALDNLFGHLELLKANIIKFTNLLPFILKDYIHPKIAAVDSDFIVGSLLNDLEDLMNQEGDLILDVNKDQIRILHEGLMLLQTLLEDIKLNLPRNSEIQELKETEMRIRNVAYEAEYVINSFLVGSAPSWYFTVRLPDIIHKIELIKTGLQEIKKNYDSGALKVAEDLRVEAPSQAKGNSDVDDSIVGFDDEETYILDQLVGGKEERQILTIFGMPGLGKTTLAKKLYNHPTVNYHFDKRSWCIVSETYQRKSLLIDILISLESGLDKVRILNMEEASLGEHIHKSLMGRRYLIVMDDVWSYNVWDDFRRYFPDGNRSRVVFTSRNKDVAPPGSIIYGLPSLSSDKCWELLEKKAFHSKPCPPELVGIGKKIAADCNGLPLAVVIIAGILSSMDEEESTWKNVRQSLALYIFSDQNNSMMQILKLSYKHLPKHLKPCFLYLGAFPKDREIPYKKLKCLWIAEGFIPKEEKKSPENVAEEYLMELIDKSLVIVAKRRTDGGVKACVVHDLLRDLCLRMAEEENFLKWVDDDYSLCTKQHRLRVNRKSISKASLRFSYLLAFALDLSLAPG